MINNYALLAASIAGVVLLLYLVVVLNDRNAKISPEGFSVAQSRTNDKILKIFMMTKNEWPVIKYWVLFHGDIYGFDNLYVYDGSDDPEVINFLTKARNLGVHVAFTQANMDQLEVLYNVDMRNETAHCDFIIKMDSDEFLYMFSAANDSVIVDKAPIQQYLNSIRIDGRKYAVEFGMISYINASHCQEYLNVMTEEFYVGTTRKVIVPTVSYEHIDLGGHWGLVKPPYNNTDLLPCNFGIAHYRNQCYRRFIQLNNQVVMAHGYLNGSETREQQIEKLVPLCEGYPPGPCRVSSCHKVYKMLQYVRDPVAAQKAYEDEMNNQMLHHTANVHPQMKIKFEDLEERYGIHFL